MHFQDLARLHLELEAWERIRDARLEHRWQQNGLDRRRCLHEMERDLTSTGREQLEHGLCRVADSPAKFKRIAEYLLLIKSCLEKGNFEVEKFLKMLYGSDIKPDHDRAERICMRFQTLKSEKTPEKDLERLISLVEDEYCDAMNTHLLKLEEKNMTRFARLAGLAPGGDDRWMEMQGDRLRRAIDRKQWVINGLLQTLRIPAPRTPEDPPDPGSGSPPPP